MHTAVNKSSQVSYRIEEGGGFEAEDSFSVDRQEKVIIFSEFGRIQQEIAAVNFSIP